MMRGTYINIYPWQRWARWPDVKHIVFKQAQTVVGLQGFSVSIRYSDDYNGPIKIKLSTNKKSTYRS